MSELVLVNPRRRKRRKMSALQRKYFGRRRRSSTTRRRRRNPIGSNLLPLGMNPRRRRRRSRRSTVSHRRRRNPSLRGTLAGFTGQIVPTVKAGFTGALGGLGLDVLMGFAAPRLPVALQAGFAKDAVKVLGGVLVGILGNMILKGKGREMAVGAVTISLHDLLKAQLVTMLPQIPLGYYDAGAPLGAYLSNDAGATMSGYGAYVDSPETIGAYSSQDDDDLSEF